MNKSLAGILLAIASIAASTASSAEIMRPFTIDFSQVKTVQADNVNWGFYNNWDMAYATKVDTASASGWNGVTLQTFAQGPYISKNAFQGHYITVQNIGLTNNAAASFTAPTPLSCLVNLKAGDTLYVSGTLHIPDNSQDPYLENLNCHLN
jgi:hypothetical protein